MKIIIASLCLLVCLFIVLQLRGQETNKIRFEEISLTEGIITSNQLIGLGGGGNGPACVFMSFPANYSGSQFVTVSYLKTKKVVLRMAIGFENQQGDLTYGDEHHGPFGGMSGLSGHYSRNVYSICHEFVHYHISHKYFSTYSFFGLSATMVKNDYRFFEGIVAQDYF